MPFFAVLPVIVFILIFVCLLKRNAFGFRLAFLWSVILWTSAAVAIVEILSIPHALTREMVAGAWGVIMIVLAVVFIFSNNPQQPRSVKFNDLSIFEGIILASISVIILLVGVNAFFAAPNNWDSMTYHLPRVLHWIQNHSVEHYPTPILRQLYQPPGAEFLILHFQILSGGDQFANVIQWCAMFGSLLVLSLIAGELGAGRRGQILTAFFAATIPMGILQGSSTQNDYVAGFWLVAFVYFGLRWRKAPVVQNQWNDVIGTGLSLGFGFFTKGSIYIFALPWLLWIILTGLFKRKKHFVFEILIIIVIALVVNAGFYGRNCKLFGSPLSAGTENYMNAGGMLANGVSNVIRNAALHVGTPSPAINAVLKERILQIHSLFGLAKNDEGNTWGDFDVPAWSTSEDIAGNPLHLFLMIGVFIFVVVRPQPLLRPYCSAVTLAFVLFCVFFKWQLFHSRLQLPLFLLSMPVAGFVLEKIRARGLIAMISLLFLLYACLPLFFNERHPLIGQKNVFNMSRMEQYFSYRKFMALPYVLSAKYAVSRGGNDVGLMLGGDDWEYPLWMLLQKEKPGIRIWHSGVTNSSAALMRERDQNVEVIISEIADPPAVISSNQKTYLRQQQFSFMSVYEK